MGIASDGFYIDAHTVSFTLAGRLQSDLGACGDDLRSFYLPELFFYLS